MRPLVAIAVISAIAAHAHAGLIDFESLPANYSFGATPPGALPGLSLIDSDGVVVNISRTTTAPLDIIDLSGQVRPAHWGSNALSPYAYLGYGDIIRFTLQAPPGKWVERVEIEFGDYGSDLGYVKIEGDSGSLSPGGFYFHHMVHWSGNLASEHGTLDSGRSGRGPIARFVAMGEGLYQNSVFWDNLRLTVVPTPGIGAAGMVALLGLARRRGRSGAGASTR